MPDPTGPPPDLYLPAASLCSKWGFNDGDLPDELVDRWPPDFVYDLDWHEALSRLVRSHLIPALDAAGHRVEVYDIATLHNPIRAASIDGVEVDAYTKEVPVQLRCDGVTVPYAAVAAVCGVPAGS